LSNFFAIYRFIIHISSTQITIFNLIFKHEIMKLTIKKPTNDKKVKASNGKTVEFFSTKGVKKVYDVHQYNKTGLLYFKRKNKAIVA